MNKKLIISISAFLLIIIGFSLYNFAVPRSYIKFTVAPEQVSIRYNGITKSVKNGDTIAVNPGNYKITVSHDGFDSYTSSVSVKNGDTFELLTALKPQTDTAKQLLLNDASQLVMQRFYGDIQSNQTNTLLKDYPIINILPIQARLYTISACQSQKYPNDPTKIALCVEESQAGLDPYVLKDITSRGYNPSDYEIIWVRQYTTN